MTLLKSTSWLFALLLLGALLLDGCGAPPTCQYAGKSHEVGASFPSEDGCNTCTCEAAGGVACTEKACVLPCGGTKDLKCEKGWTCVYPVGKCGESVEGQCQRGIACDETTGVVCGCDGDTKGCALIAGKFIAEGKCAPCTANNKSHESGTTFKSTDGCNTCSCNNGELTCSQKECTPVCTKGNTTYKQGESYKDKDSCEECTCDQTKFTCQLYACKSPCKDDATGKIYQPGDSYRTAGGCEQCVCGDMGRVICKDSTCYTCTHKGKTYKLNETFPAEDGCNSCTCDDGKVNCTTKTCVRRCGEPQDPKCEVGEICAYSVGGDCKAKRGVCQKKETCGEEDKPVCGCDGKTYVSHCEALQQEVPVQYLGECKEKKPCGTRGSALCESSQYCNQPSHCGSSGKGGFCEPKPTSCDTKKEAVCACDGNSYDNACKAAMAGTSIKFPGACN